MTQRLPAPGRQGAAWATHDQPTRSCHASRDTASEQEVSLRAYTHEHALARLVVIAHFRRNVVIHQALCWMDQFYVRKAALEPTEPRSAVPPTDGGAQ